MRAHQLAGQPGHPLVVRYAQSVAEMAAAVVTATPTAPLLLLKWQLIGRALMMPSLSAGDAAVLWFLIERYNEQAGAAWPSLVRLALDTGRDQRTVQRSLKRLMVAGLVELAQRGTRTTSNRYRVVFEKVGAPAPVQVGAPESQGRGADAAKVGAPAPVESIYEPGQETGFISGSCPAPATAGAGGAAGTTPPAATPGAPNTGRDFPEFWSTYPKAINVFKTECAIKEFISAGVVLSDIVQGARRYATWLKVQHWGNESKYIKNPLTWVRDRCWLDDYIFTPAKLLPAPAGGRPSDTAEKAQAKQPALKGGARSGTQPQEPAARWAGYSAVARGACVKKKGYTWKSGPAPSTEKERQQLAAEHREFKSQVQLALTTNPALRQSLEDVLTSPRLNRWMGSNPGNIARSFTPEQMAKVRLLLAEGAYRATGSQGAGDARTAP